MPREHRMHHFLLFLYEKEGQAPHASSTQYLTFITIGSNVRKQKE